MKGRELNRAPARQIAPGALERIAQGELNKARSAHGAGDFTERTVRDADGLDVGDGGIAEVGVVPDVEEVGGKTDGVALGQLEILDEREIPILLRRAAVNVASEVAKSGGAEVGVGKDGRVRLIGVALGRIEKRSGGERGRIQITVDALADTAAGDAARDGAAGSKLTAECAGSEAETEEGTTSAGIGDRERCTGLEDGDSADRPAAKEGLGEALGRSEERQVVAIADHQAMSAVKIGEAARAVQGGFVVKRGVERSVAGGSCVSGPGPGVSGLEVTTGPAAGERGLQRMIVGVRVIGEELKAGVTVDSLNERAGDGVAERVGGDGRRSGACGVRKDNRVVSGIAGLQAVAGFAEMDGVGADVADFENPLFAKRALNGQVPLLSIGHHEVARDLQTKDVYRGERTGASTAGGRDVVCRLRGVAARKTVEEIETRNKRWIKGSSLRQRVGIGAGASGQRILGEEGGEAARCASAKCDGQEWGLERELVHGADIFPHVVDAVTGTDGGVVMAEEVVGQADSWT